MINWFNSLNLKPSERRMVIVAAIVFFVLINVWFVWPHFGDWAKSNQQVRSAEQTVILYQREVNNIPKYRAQVKSLEKDGGATIASAEQAVHFQKTVQELASRSGVSINRYDPANPRRATVAGAGGANSQTNSYFEESGLSVQMQQVDEESLVLFLYNLGNGNSNVRVKELELSPNNTGGKLQCKALLIASYQKAQPAKSATLAPSAKMSIPAVNKNTAKTNTASVNTETNKAISNTNQTVNTTMGTNTATAPSKVSAPATKK